MNRLSAQALADLAGVTEAEVVRLVELGILVARDGAEPFLEVDVPKVRLAVACERAGLPMERTTRPWCGAAVVAFLEGATFQQWAVPSGRTYDTMATGEPAVASTPRGTNHVAGERPSRL
jgi:hypothetical protein